MGAILFSIGLLTILNMNFKLFTGSVGYIKTIEDVKMNAVILLGNIIGACGILLFPQATAISIISTKLLAPLHLVFIKGIICGIFIYTAVSCYKQGKDYMVLTSVVGFIMFGAEHCIADLCYALAAGVFSIDILLFLIVTVIGNSIGALLIDRL